MWEGRSACYPVMSRLVASLVKQSLTAHLRRYAKLYGVPKEKLTYNRKKYYTFFLQPGVPVVRQRQRGFFELVSISPLAFSKRSREYPKELLISGGLLTYLGLGKKDEEKDSELIMTMKRGILLMQRGELKKSEQMLHLALKLAQEQQNKDAITYIYDILANVAYEANEHEKAEKLFLSVLQRELSKGTQKDDNKVVHISLKLAHIYQEVGNSSKAEEGFKFCEELLQKKVNAGASDEDTLLLWAMTLDWYARFVLNQGRYKEAFQFFEKAYKTSVNVNGEVHEQNVVLLNDLGTICCLQNDYERAIKYLQDAVNIGKKLPDMEDMAAIYVNLGAVYMKNMMLEEAKRACQEGWKNAKTMNNKEGLDEASICLDELKTKLPA